MQRMRESRAGVSPWAEALEVPGDALEAVTVLTDAELTALWGFTRSLAEARGLNAVAQLAARSVLEASGARSARVLLLDDSNLETVAVANQLGVSSVLGTGLSFETFKPVDGYQRALERKSVESEGERGLVALVSRDRAVGLLEVLGAENLRRVGLYATPAALALEGARLNAERLRFERESKALSEFGRAIGETLSLEAVLQRTLEFAVKTLGLERGMLGLYSDVRETTAIAKDFYAHNLKLSDDDDQLVISPESFERLVVKNQPIVLNEVATSSRSFAVGPREIGAEAFLMVPLSARGKPLGVLYVDSTRPGLEITERTVSLAQAMAEVASLAIENAQLYAQESQKRQSAEGLREVVLTLSSSLNVSDTLQTILEQANRLLGASGCAVFERIQNVLEPRASLGIEDIESLGRGADALVVQEALSKLELVVREVEGRSVIATPLFARGESFGGIALYFSELRVLGEEELGVLTAFAAQAGVALGNARAFADELTLLEIAKLTGSTLSLEEVLKRVSEEVVDALDLERCFIGFFDGIDYSLERAELGRLYAHGFPDGLEGFLKPFVIAEDAFQRLVTEQEPIVINEAQDESLESEGPTLLGAQSFIVAPVVAQGEVLGVLYADSTRTSQITAREERLCAAIAAQAALAIQNARLFESIQAQEMRYRLLAEAAHDLIVATDLEGIITYANPAVLEVLGFAPEELIGTAYDDLLIGETATEAQRAWREMTEDGFSASTFEGRVRRSDGSSAYLEVKLNALFREGKIAGGLAIARDLSEQQKLADEIAQRGQAQARATELRSFLSLFTQAQEEERRRIARELHDDTAQTLVAIARRLDRLESALSNMPLASAQERVRDIRSDVDSAIDSVRRFSRNLRPSALDDLGLLPALEWLCSQARTPARLEVSGDERRLPVELELTLYRVVQEALTNVDKHAKAHSAAVRVRFEPHLLEVSVIDDGQGFAGDPDENLLPAGHLGVAGMRERIALAGGEMQVHSSLGAGTRLTFRFPL
jgi:two-component system, NarL family, sensor histidine kinase UhpB